MSAKWEKPETVDLDGIGTRLKELFFANVKVMCSHLHIATYHKCQSFFFRVGPESSGRVKTDLRDHFVWAKHCSLPEAIHDKKWIDVELSNVLKQDKHLQLAVVHTMFNSCVIIAEASSPKCKVFFEGGADSDTVRIGVIREKSETKPVIVGVSIVFPYFCMGCKKDGSKACKLRWCSRCYRYDHMRVFYCSKECQLSEYPDHKRVCHGDWCDPGDWECGQF